MSPENGSKSDTEANFDPENDSIINFEQFEHFETDIELDQVFFFQVSKATIQSPINISPSACKSGIKPPKQLNLNHHPPFRDV